MSVGAFFGNRSQGVHPPSNKVTADRPMERANPPKVAYLPLSQHIGAPAKAIVKRNDEVKVGQKIAEAGGYVSVPIHSTVSGRVTKITQTVNVITGRPMDVVVIESDGKDEWVQLNKVGSLDALTVDDILKRIQDAGIVGMGGATFPTHVKLKPPQGKEIDTLIINGAECEPWITSDHRLMLEEGDKLLSGIRVLLKVLPVPKVIIGIEKNKPDAIQHLSQLVQKEGMAGTVEVVPLKQMYPMGGEKTLTKVLLGREVPIGGLPLDIGVVVQNVSTVKAIHDAIFEGIPLIERGMTVTGMVKEPRNLMVRFGTPIGELLEQCGGMKDGANQVLFGGPMMGLAQYSMDTPVIKGTNCLLVKPALEEKERDCIRCAACINHCPMDLMPTQYVNLTKYRKFEEIAQHYIADCIECGSCSYICPAKIPIVQYIKLAKAEIRRLGL